MKNLAIEQIKFATLEIGETYQVTNNGKTYTFKVTDKKSGFGSGKKSVITCNIDCDGTLVTELIDKDITVLKKHLDLTSEKAPRGTRKAEQHEKLKKLYSDFVALANEMYDYLTEEDAVEDVESVISYVGAFEQVITKAVARLEGASKANKDAQKQINDILTSGKFTTEQLLQFAQFMQSTQSTQTSEQSEQ
jgi:hypothetical protein